MSSSPQMLSSILLWNEKQGLCVLIDPTKPLLSNAYLFNHFLPIKWAARRASLLLSPLSPLLEPSCSHPGCTICGMVSVSLCLQPPNCSPTWCASTGAWASPWAAWSVAGTRKWVPSLLHIPTCGWEVSFPTLHSHSLPYRIRGTENTRL